MNAVFLNNNLDHWCGVSSFEVGLQYWIGWAPSFVLSQALIWATVMRVNTIGVGISHFCTLQIGINNTCLLLIIKTLHKCLIYSFSLPKFIIRHNRVSCHVQLISYFPKLKFDIQKEERAVYTLKSCQRRVNVSIHI